MNRRNLLQSFGLLLLAPLVTTLGWAKVTEPQPKKYYLGYNQPYDRSLVNFTRGSNGILTATLFWEPTPGATPNCITAMSQSEYDLEQFHSSTQRFLERCRSNNMNAIGVSV
jgi:hypothetical protein